MQAASHGVSLPVSLPNSADCLYPTTETKQNFDCTAMPEILSHMSCADPWTVLSLSLLGIVGQVQSSDGTTTEV